MQNRGGGRREEVQNQMGTYHWQPDTKYVEVWDGALYSAFLHPSRLWPDFPFA